MFRAGKYELQEDWSSETDWKEKWQDYLSGSARLRSLVTSRNRTAGGHGRNVGFSLVSSFSGRKVNDGMG